MTDLLNIDLGPILGGMDNAFDVFDDGLHYKLDFAPQPLDAAAESALAKTLSESFQVCYVAAAGEVDELDVLTALHLLFSLSITRGIVPVARPCYHLKCGGGELPVLLSEG